MIKFYSVILTKFGKETETLVVCTFEQANDWAIKEASQIGATYDVRLVATHDLNGIKNLTNY